MKSFKESALKVRQQDIKPMTKIMANQYVEKGNVKKIMDLLKHMGKKVKLDVPKEKSSSVVWTVEGRMNEDVNVKSIDKFKAAARDIGKNKDIDSQSIADALSKIVTAVRMLDKSTSGRTDVKYEKIISKESTRINNIVNKLNYGKDGVTPEGKEIVKLLNKHGLNRPFRTIIFEGEEMQEAIDYMKVSKELDTYAKKNGGPDKREFEKAAAYVREIGRNSAVSVQDKAGKGLNMLFKNADTDVRDRMQMILTKGGFKVKGGYVMRESTAAYGKSLSDIRNKRKMAAIKPKDRDTLKKLSDLMKRANEDAVEEGKWFVRQSAKPNKTGTYQGKKYDDGKKAIAQARKDWKLTPDEHMSAKMMKEAIEEGLDARQIALLKKNYASIDRIDPSGPAYKKAKGMISGLDKDMQMDLAKAKVKFLSQIAADELRKQHGVKLKAKDYMESVTTNSFSELRNK